MSNWWDSAKATNYRKWAARTVISIAGVLIMWLTTGSWDAEESIAMVTVVAGALASFLVPADPPAIPEKPTLASPTR